MKNEYEIRGEVTAIIINSKKHGRLEALISTSKLERAKEFSGSWSAWWCDSVQSFYVSGHTKRENGKNKKKFLHRWLTFEPIGKDVDHFDHDTLNNTDINLRVVTHAENKQNFKNAMINSKSGFRGVSWSKECSKWQVQVTINKAQKRIGYFDDIKEAEHASIEARKKYMPFSQEASA